LTAALGRITAKATIVAFTGDVMFSPEDSRRHADHIAGAEYRETTTPSGHLTTFALTDEDRQAMDEAIRDALAA
jgi:homoserine O-acetyltransferase/O-succinyltransferase